MHEPTVTGKAAWDAIQRGDRLFFPDESQWFEMRGARIVSLFPGDAEVYRSSLRKRQIVAGEWIVRPRIGDSPVWSEG